MRHEAIQTTVDKLVSLVIEYGKISFKDAAKTLAVGVSTIEEWAYALEEEGVILIEYKLQTPYLVKKEFSAAQKAEKVKEFAHDRELFTKKLEAAGSYFNELDKKIVVVKKLLEDMSGNFDQKLAQVNQDITNLVQAEARKQQLDVQIVEAKKRSTENLRQVEDHIKQLKASYDIEYTQSKKTLMDDKAKLIQDEKFLERVQNQENLLQQRLVEVRTLAQSIQDEVNARTKMLADTQSRMGDLHKKHEKLLLELETQHNRLIKITQENEAKEKIIKQSQEQLFAKIDAEEKALTLREKEIQTLPQRFSSLMGKKDAIHSLLDDISHEEVDLKAQIEELRKHARIIEASVGSADFHQELTALSQRVDKINEMRSFFKEKILKLTQLLDFKK